MLLSGDPGFILHASVEASNFLLLSKMKVLKVSLPFGLIFSLLGPELELSLFKGLLGTNLIDSSLAILSSLLHLLQALHFALFVFLTLKAKLLDHGDHIIQLWLALPDEVIALSPGSLVNERSGGHAAQHLLLPLLGLSLTCLARKYV